MTTKTHTPSQSRARRWLRRFAWTILAGIVLVAVLGLVTQTGWFRNWVKGMIEETANESLNGQFQIGSLEGNLFTESSLHDIRLLLEGDTLVAIDAVYLAYSPLELLNENIWLDSVLIQSPRVNLAQDENGEWNVMRLLPETTAETAPSDQESGGFGYAVVLNRFRLAAGSLRIESTTDMIPHRIDSLAISLTGEYHDTRQQLTLENLAFNTVEPDFQLRHLSFDLARNEDSTSLRDFQLATARNELFARATYTPTDTTQSQAEMESQPLQFEEFAFALPEMTITASPELDLQSHLVDDSLRLNLALIEPSQRIDLQLSVDRISALFDSLITPRPQFDLTVALDNIVPVDWLAEAPADLLLNGTIQVTGTGLTAEQAVADVRASLVNCLVAARPLRQLDLTAAYDRGDAACSLMVDAPSGKATLTAVVTDLLGVPQTSARGIVRNLDLAQALLDDSLKSDITTRFDVDLSGLTLAELQGRATLAIAPSSMQTIAIDTANTDLRFDAGLITIDTMYLLTGPAEVHGRGTIDSALVFDADLHVLLRDLAELQSIADVGTLAGSGTIEGRVSGTADSAACDLNLRLQDVAYEDYRVARIEGTAAGTVGAESMALAGRIEASQALAAEMTIEQVEADYAFDMQQVAVQLAVTVSDSVRLQTSANITLDSTTTIALESLQIGVRGHDWQLTGPAVFTVGEEAYRIEGFALEGTKAQGLRANGTISLTGEEDLAVSLTDINLTDLGAMLELQVPIGGGTSADLSLTGTAEQPRLESSLRLLDGRYAEYAFDSLVGDVTYRSDSLTAKITLTPGSFGDLSIQALVPMTLSLADPPEIVVDEIPIDMTLTADSLSLDVLGAAGIETDRVEGYIQGEINLDHTIGEPHLFGSIALRNGKMDLPDRGINFSPMHAALSFDSTIVTLDTLHLVRKDGHLTARGSVEFENDLMSGIVKSSELEMEAKNLFLVRHEDFEINISGDAFVRGTVDSPTFGGTITVNRARIFLPAVTGEEDDATAELQNVPMLVRATRADSLVADSVERAQAQPTQEIAQVSEFQENLQGRLKVLIPRNTWVRSPEMQMELRGDIDVVKESPDFELFGTIDIIRGHYDLYGRRFEVEEGRLTFQGGTEMNPRLDLEAKYTFRTPARQKRTLTLFLTGTALEPRIAFKLDGKEIAEGEALCYLIFGSSCDQVSGGQQAAGGNGESNIAQTIAASLLSKQLTGAIGKQLNLDVIEIKAKESFEAATFVVGKYLTNDLFVSYERSVGSVEDDDIAREYVTIEYEVLKFLFLQFTEGEARESGLDVIFKKEF